MRARQKTVGWNSSNNSPLILGEIRRGQVPTIIKAFFKAVTRPCYQAQTSSMTDNNFLFFDIAVEAVFKKVTFS
jgi:hypothetical protein